MLKCATQQKLDGSSKAKYKKNNYKRIENKNK